MRIEDIIVKLQALNGTTPAPKKSAKKKPSVAIAAPKANTHTPLNPDEILSMSVARIVAAFELEEQGVTVESMIAGVKAHEGTYAGRVM